MHFLALSAELIEVYSDDFNAVEALMSILITNLFEVGRQLINEQMQCIASSLRPTDGYVLHQRRWHFHTQL